MIFRNVLFERHTNAEDIHTGSVVPEDFAQADRAGPFRRPSQSPGSPPRPFPVASLASKAMDSFGLLFSHVNEITPDIFCLLSAQQVCL